VEANGQSTLCVCNYALALSLSERCDKRRKFWKFSKKHHFFGKFAALRSEDRHNKGNKRRKLKARIIVKLLNNCQQPKELSTAAICSLGVCVLRSTWHLFDHKYVARTPRIIKTLRERDGIGTSTHTSLTDDFPHFYDSFFFSPAVDNVMKAHIHTQTFISVSISRHFALLLLPHRKILLISLSPLPHTRYY
jgi:hypothetical protein